MRKLHKVDVQDKIKTVTLHGVNIPTIMWKFITFLEQCISGVDPVTLPHHLLHCIFHFHSQSLSMELLFEIFSS